MTALACAFWQYVRAWLSNVLALFCQSIKHTVLERAHPLPSTVKIRARRGGVSATVLESIVEQVGIGSIVSLDLDGAENAAVVCVDGDDEVIGTMAAIRYLGRLSRTYSTRPALALRLDSALDSLLGPIECASSWEGKPLVKKSAEDSAELWMHAQIAHPCMTLFASLDAIERRFEKHDEWMDGFDNPTILDASWRGMIRWLFVNEIYTIHAMHRQFPFLSAWWDRISNDEERAKRDSGNESMSESTHDDRGEEMRSLESPLMHFSIIKANDRATEQLIFTGADANKDSPFKVAADWEGHDDENEDKKQM